MHIEYVWIYMWMCECIHVCILCVCVWLFLPIISVAICSVSSGDNDRKCVSILDAICGDSIYSISQKTFHLLRFLSAEVNLAITEPRAYTIWVSNIDIKKLIIVYTFQLLQVKSCSSQHNRIHKFYEDRIKKRVCKWGKLAWLGLKAPFKDI